MPCLRSAFQACQSQRSKRLINFLSKNIQANRSSGSPLLFKGMTEKMRLPKKDFENQKA